MQLPIKLLLLASLLLTGTIQIYAQPQPNNKQTIQSAHSLQNANLSYELIPAANNTWGYTIIAEGRSLIRQTTIPGMQGNEGFKTKPSAKKIALLVIAKIKKGEMPPTVSIEEMKKLKAL